MATTVSKTAIILWTAGGDEETNKGLGPFAPEEFGPHHQGRWSIQTVAMEDRSFFGEEDDAPVLSLWRAELGEAREVLRW